MSAAVSRASSRASAGRAPFRALLRLAWRESRTARRRLLLYMSSIALGVAALVAIDSFAANVGTSVREQSRALVGGDVQFTARSAFTRGARTFLDSLGRSGSRVARVTSFASMAVAARTGRTRLVQVRAVEAGYPFYGTVTTRPAGRWAALQGGARALVDPSLLVALDARVGDTLTLGYGRFRIDGTLDNVPGDPGIAAVLGPRVYIPARYLAETQLLVFGSRAEYEAVAQLPPGVDANRFVRQRSAAFDRIALRARTVADTERGLTQSVDRLTDFLSVVGLIALLLGGVGVASGVGAFVARKLDTVAVLRCLGATSRQVLLVYVTQAAIMGLAGAAAGAALGLGMQWAIPRAIGDFLPVDVVVRPEPAAIVSGLLVGVWVALVFALRPLLSLRRVSPLQAIRREVDPGAARRRGVDWLLRVVDVAVVASVFLLALDRTGRTRDAVGVTIAIFVAIGLLWASAAGATRLARRLVRAGWPYAVRQGVANLYRPGSQTRAVTLALGFGAFLVSTVYLVRGNLLRDLDTRTSAARANVLFFDVQEEQGPVLDSLVRARGYGAPEAGGLTPIVTMRIAALNGRTTAQLLADSTARRPDGGRRAPWALRREYRSTYRARMGGSERVTEGRFFTGDGADGVMPEMSLEAGVARELGVALGDTVTWDVSGVRVPTRVTSFREVEWARFEPNFFAVFQPSALRAAPKQFVLLARVPGDEAVALLQREVVGRYPNVASIDLSLVQRTVGRIVERVSLAVRFLGAFCLAMGIPVLFSAVAATRRDRMRDAVLLKTLGATRAQVRRVLLAEYTALGVLGSAAGVVLSFGGAWGLAKYVFRQPFRPDWLAALGVAALLTAVTVAIGLLTGREAYRGTPAAALREG